MSNEKSPTENPTAGNSGLPVSTLGDYGYNLPIGVVEGNPPQLAKSFAFKAYTTRDEREFGKLRRKKGGPGDHNGKIVAEILAYFLTEWGGDSNFANKSHKVRLNAILSANMTDVLYAYLMLRCEALGESFEVGLECPRTTCAHEWDWSADLRSVDFSVVRTPEDIAELTFVLRSPIEQGSHQYDTLTIVPPKWSAVANVSGRANEGEIKAKLILGAVAKVEASGSPEAPPTGLGMHMLDSIVKRDLEELSREINDTFPSIDLSLEVECPECERSFVNRVNWQFDFFFGPSSLPRRKSA